MRIVAIEAGDACCSHAAEAEACFHEVLITLHAVGVENAGRYGALKSIVIFKTIAGAKVII